MSEGIRVTNWFKNKAALKARGPQEAALADFLESLDSNNYETSRSAVGEPILTVKTKAGAMLPIDHPENPVAEAQTIVARADAKTRLFLVMGAGLGYLLEAAMLAFPRAQFLVIEKDPRIFKSWLTARDAEAVIGDPRVTFFVGIKPDFIPGRFIEYFSLFDHDLHLPAVSVLMNKRIVDYTRDYYESVSKIFSNSVQRYWDFYVGNDADDSLVGLNNALKNIRHIGKTVPLHAFHQAGRDKIGVVVSAGPSLNESLPRLKEIADKCLIICADSVLHTLLKMGITPFGVACLERIEKNERLFHDYDLPRGSVLFAPPVIRPWIVENYPGPICFMNRWAFPFQWFDEWSPPLNFGTSCSHLAYVSLRELGCREIALLGQDLAYAPTGESHFTFAHEVVSGGWQAKNKTVVENADGEPLETNEIWLSFRDTFQDFIAADRTSGKKITNVMPHGFGAKLIGADLETPDVFFARVALEPANVRQVQAPSFGEKGEAILSQLRERKAATLKKMQSLLDEKSDWQAASSAESYQSSWRRALFDADPKIRGFLSEVGKPMARRFSALICDPDISDEEFGDLKKEFLSAYLPVLAEACRILADDQL